MSSQNNNDIDMLLNKLKQEPNLFVVKTDKGHFLTNGSVKIFRICGRKINKLIKEGKLKQEQSKIVLNG